MAEMRKRFFGNKLLAQLYTREASNLLEIVKHSMKFAGLQQLSRKINLPNGVALFAASRFGQDEIQVFAPVSGMAKSGMETENQISWWRLIGDVSIPGVDNSTPAIWDQTGSLTVLGKMGNHDWDFAVDISEDGNTILGYGQNYALGSDAWFWKEATGYQALGLGTGQQYMYIRGMSHDCRVVVGSTYRSDVGKYFAFYWTEADGLIYLPRDGSFHMAAEGVSGDGNYVVGYRYIVGGYAVAFRYSIETLEITYEGVSTRNNIFYGASKNGGVLAATDSNSAAIWTPDTNFTLLDGTGGRATSISDSGRTVGGYDFSEKFGNPSYVHVPWYWSAPNGKTLLPDAGFSYTSELALGEGANVYCMDTEGTVFGGNAMGANAQFVPAWWDLAGKITLPDIGGYTEGAVRGVAIGKKKV